MLSSRSLLNRVRLTRGAPSRRVCVCPFAAGFGKTNKKQQNSSEGSGIYTAPNRKKRVDLKKEFAEERAASTPAVPVADPDQDLSKGNWFDLASTADFANKPRKLVELKGNKTMVVLHQYNGQIYAMDAYSTAYQYPLLDAKISDGADGPTIETPLDGTVYDLKTGKVIKWVPSNGSPIRGLLRTLKASVQPVPLPVYPVVITPANRVMVRLSKSTR